MKISMTGVHGDDSPEAFTYYTETLGFKELMFIPEAELAIVVSPEEPDGTALLLEPDTNPIAKTIKKDCMKLDSRPSFLAWRIFKTSTND